jgi:beta-galactosidase beta subunit
MIVTDLDHLHEQMPATVKMLKALKFLKTARHQILPDGRVEIDGNCMLWLNLQTTWENAN